MPFEFTCDRCGAKFMRHTQRTGVGGVYCSRPCYWLSMRKPAPHRTCVGCGAEFDPRVGGGRKPNLTRNYCNRACYDAYRSQTLNRWLEEQSGDGCWPWPHGVNKDGYGVTHRSEDHRQQLVHRVVWTLLVGPIPDDMTLDHMCHNRDETCRGGRSCAHRRCANPVHLVVAEGAVNTLRGKNPWAINARKTHCKHGHPFDVANTYYTPEGARQCRTCRRLSSDRYNRRRRKGAAA